MHPFCHFLFSGTSSDSVSPEDIKDDENGLPSPPLDEGAFLTTQTASIEMSEVVLIIMPELADFQL